MPEFAKRAAKHGTNCQVCEPEYGTGYVPRAVHSIAGVRVCRKHWTLVVRIAARAWLWRSKHRLTIQPENS